MSDPFETHRVEEVVQARRRWMALVEQAAMQGDSLCASLLVTERHDPTGFLSTMLDYGDYDDDEMGGMF